MKQVDTTKEKIVSWKIDLNEMTQNEIRRENRIGKYDISKYIEVRGENLT